MPSNPPKTVLPLVPGNLVPGRQSTRKYLTLAGICLFAWRTPAVMSQGDPGPIKKDLGPICLCPIGAEKIKNEKVECVSKTIRSAGFSDMKLESKDKLNYLENSK